jgi:hypothetical protein
MESALSPSSDEPLSALAESVLDDATSAFPPAAALARRSLQFSHGYHARGLLALLDQFLTGDAARLALAVRAARRRCQLGDGGGAGSRGPSPVPLPPSSSAAAGAGAGAEAPGVFDWDDLQVRPGLDVM